MLTCDWKGNHGQTWQVCVKDFNQLARWRIWNWDGCNITRCCVLKARFSCCVEDSATQTPASLPWKSEIVRSWAKLVTVEQTGEAGRLGSIWKAESTKLVDAGYRNMTKGEAWNMPPRFLGGCWFVSWDNSMKEEQKHHGKIMKYIYDVLNLRCLWNIQVKIWSQIKTQGSPGHWKIISSALVLAIELKTLKNHRIKEGGVTHLESRVDVQMILSWRHLRFARCRKKPSQSFP
jgi:hypothetical protein